MIRITDHTHRKEYERIVFGIFEAGDVKTVEYYLYNNSTNFIFKLTSSISDWFSYYDGENYVKLTNPIDLGEWEGFKKLTFKITVPSTAIQNKYDLLFEINDASIPCELAINYTLDIESIITEAVFGS